MRSLQRSTELPCPRRAATGSITGHHATRAGFAFKWADESDKKTSICAISASSSSFLIKGNSREDSLTVTLPGTTGGYKYAYAISMGKCEIRNCSLDITVIGGMQNAGDNVAIRVSDLKIKNAALNLIVGKDRQENVQKAMQGGCLCHR